LQAYRKIHVANSTAIREKEQMKLLLSDGICGDPGKS
jgi:hypothetical protein